MSSSPTNNIWQQNRQRIQTQIGQWLAGEDVIVRGRSLFYDLLHELDFAQLHVLNLTGRLIDKNLSHWLDRSIFFTSYPDVRIWCNQLGAMAAVQKTSPVAAHAIGSLAADSKAYGSKAQYLTVLALQTMRQRQMAGDALADIVEAFPKRRGFPIISGFARPVRVADERLQPARDLSKKYHFEPGEHVQLAEAVSDYLLDQYGLGMNAAAYSSAFLMDRGFSAEEIYRLRAADVCSGVMACYADYFARPDNSLLPLQCDDINYQGVSKRHLKPI